MSTGKLGSLLLIIGAAAAVIFTAIGFLGGDGSSLPQDGTDVYGYFASSTLSNVLQARVGIVVQLIISILILYGYWAISNRITINDNKKTGLSQLALVVIMIGTILQIASVVLDFAITTTSSGSDIFQATAFSFGWGGGFLESTGISILAVAMVMSGIFNKAFSTIAAIIYGFLAVITALVIIVLFDSTTISNWLFVWPIWIGSQVFLLVWAISLKSKLSG